MFYTYGIKLGAELVRRGRVGRGLRYLLQPVNYWRVQEFDHTLKNLSPARGEAILDIGSPKLFPILVADRFGAHVTATDIEDYFIDDSEFIRTMRGISARGLHFQREDGRALSFHDESFDKVFSISVIEHIPGDGDTRCIQEIARVLKPGGIACLTIPFGHTMRDENTKKSFYWSKQSTQVDTGETFFQRRYDLNGLHERLITPSGLDVERMTFIGERVFTKSEAVEFNDFLHPLTGLAHPLLSMLVHTKGAEDPSRLKKPLCAVLVLRKPYAMTRAA